MVWLLLVACGGAPTPEAPPPSPASPVPVLSEPQPSAAVLPIFDFRTEQQALTSPAAAPATEGLLTARALLFGVVEQYALDGDNPWAMGHGLLALGPEATLASGESVVDTLFSRYAEPLDVAGETLIRFPTARGDIRIEPHADLVLKVITEIGVSPQRPVVVNGQSHLAGDLYRGSLARAWVDGEQTGFASYNDTPWALQGLTSWGPPELAWTAQGGHAMTLHTFTTASVAHLQQQTAFMRDAIAAGQTVQKRRQFIFDYTCGGAHLFQGSAMAVGQGYGTEADRLAIVAELDVYFWRAQLELSQIDELLRTQPDYAPLLLEQRLKFTGHLLESAHKVWALGLSQPSPAQRELIGILREQLIATVLAIETMGIWDKLPEVRASNEQVYLDYIGDAAHALRAIDLSTGEGAVLR